MVDMRETSAREQAGQIIRQPQVIRLLTAHRDQSSSKSEAGFRASKWSGRTLATPSQVFTQWTPVASSLRYRCGGSAGITPASQFSERIQLAQHLDDVDMTIGIATSAVHLRHRDGAVETKL
jgi:hypothetical protein